MNTLKNTVCLIGRLGVDPELTTFESGMKKARFSLATSSNYKDKSGEWKEDTQWHNIVVWGKSAELTSKLLKKGIEVAIEGKLENDSYTGKDGEKRYTTYVNMREFVILTRDKKDN